MILSILKQIWNRRMSNIWISVELMLVFVLIWFMADYLLVLVYNKYMIKDYLNSEHTWEVRVAEYPDSHSEYKAEYAEPESKLESYKRIIAIIQGFKGVEAVGVSYDRGTPGSGNYNGWSFRSEHDTVLYVSGQIRRIAPEYDYLKVFGYSEGEGKKAVSTGDYDYNLPSAILISESVARQLFPDISPIGQTILRDKRQFTVAGVVDNIKRFWYERPQDSYYIYNSINDNSRSVDGATISIRSSASISDAAFAESFNSEMMNTLRAGNYYFKRIISYQKTIADTDAEWGVTSAIKLRFYMMAFFLMNILLCVTGTFWYRINIRREETGIRKSLGASNSSIRNCLIFEGLILLTIAALPAMLMEYQLVHLDIMETIGRDVMQPDLYILDRQLERFLLTNAITWLVMAIVIIAAIWLPARKASVMPAAEALHYE